MTEQAISYRFISSDEQLAGQCQHWLNSPYLALDTEFMRVDTFYPQAALIQIQDEQHCWLIDPLKITQWEPLANVLSCESVLKVLHACSEDLDVFLNLTGETPYPLIDTQVALAFLGETLSMGYQKMVEHWLQISIPKEETRSDWLQRPLTNAQCEYAAADVFYLYQIWPLIQARLAEQNREIWCREECLQIVRQARQPIEDEFYYLRVKQAWKLSQEKLAVLQNLAAWREKEARKRNQPRGRLLNDGQLWLLAFKLPGNRYDLSQIEGLRPAVIKKEGDTLLELIRAGRERSQALWPVSIPSPVGQPYRDWSKNLKKLVRRIAEQHNLPPELLVRKRQLEQVLNRAVRGELGMMPEEWRGWREDLVGQPLLDKLAEMAGQ